MRAALGVDVGTQGTKAGLYDEDGTLIAEAYAEHGFSYPHPGWVEMDPLQVEQAVTDAIRQAVVAGGAVGVGPGQISALAISGICCGPVLIDQDWQPVRPIIPFLDVRAQQEVQWIRQEVEPWWIEESGTDSLDTYITPATVHWVRNHEPEVHDRVRKVLSLAPYVAGRLAGLRADQAFTDPTHLSGWIIGWDAGTADFSLRQIDALRIDPAILPKVVPSTHVIGLISQDAARRTGLLAGTPIAAGAGDIMQSNLASGITEAGQAGDVAGTASLLTVGVTGRNRRLSTIPGMLYSLGTLPGQSFYWGYVKAGGLSLRWFRDQVAERSEAEDFYPAMDARAARVPPGSDGVQFWPYLSGGGPDLAQASGTWLGLTTGSDAAVLWRSMLEAIAFEYRDYLQAFRSEGVGLCEVRAIGGGSRSPLWNQIKADVTGVPWRVPSRQDGAILANAALALVSAGVHEDLRALIGEWVHGSGLAHPQQEARQAYDSVAQVRSRLLADSLRTGFDQVAALRQLAGPSAAAIHDGQERGDS